MTLREGLYSSCIRRFVQEVRISAVRVRQTAVTEHSKGPKEMWLKNWLHLIVGELLVDSYVQKDTKYKSHIFILITVLLSEIIAKVAELEKCSYALGHDAESSVTRA